jgi:hypothetical protein
MDGTAGPGARADLELVRVSIAPEGAFGVILVDLIPTGVVTLERTYPVAESAPRGAQFVKIPPGFYRCVRTAYMRGGYDSYEVTGVAGHSRLLFHAGNDELNSEGCILVGQRFGLLNGQPAVLSSQLGFGEFIRLAAGRAVFGLLVRNAL